MWCQYDALGQLLQPCVAVCQDVQRVGIYDDGALGAPQLTNQGDSGLIARAQSRPYAHSLEVLCGHPLGKGGLFAIYLYDGFGHGRLHDGYVALWCVCGHFPYSASQTGFCGQDGGSCHAVAAGNDECVAHLSFMGKGVAWL